MFQHDLLRAETLLHVRGVIINDFKLGFQPLDLITEFSVFLLSCTFLPVAEILSDLAISGWWVLDSRFSTFITATRALDTQLLYLRHDAVVHPEI